MAPSPCGMIPMVFQEAPELLSTWIRANGCGIGLWIARMRPELGLRRDPWSWFEALGLGLSGCFLRSKRILKFQVFPRISLLGAIQITWDGEENRESLSAWRKQQWSFGNSRFYGLPSQNPRNPVGNVPPPQNPFPLGGEKSPKTQRKSGNELIINGFPAGSRFGILHAEILMEWLIPKDYVIPALLPWDSTVSAAISQTIPQFPDSMIPCPLSLMAKFVSLTGPFPSARN